jgi:hypothetical protein
MPRYYGKTTARGYGGDHQRIRRTRLAQWRPGDPCAHCGLPMLYAWLITANGRRVSALDLPHNDQRTGYLPGLAHRGCNRRDGQRKTAAINRARGMTRQQITAIRMKQWQAASARR